MSENSKLNATAHRIVSMLVQADNDDFESLTNSRRLTATEIAEGMREYGGTLIMPPEIAFENLDLVEVSGAKPKEWNVNLNLWTVEEGCSDLTLGLTHRENEKKYTTLK